MSALLVSYPLFGRVRVRRVSLSLRDCQSRPLRLDSVCLVKANDLITTCVHG